MYGGVEFTKTVSYVIQSDKSKSNRFDDQRVSWAEIGRFCIRWKTVSDG
ncbi:hypothetical protein T12_15596 [Trichinella patagoniensis]|uniref:Uncharacterized protein n=1 Tax=Trichinella patagoniensis TaxID=990121 RepID=A0A0V0Z2P9_9BILA|nr:hypothetical protein T12_15596 [Trichinella patagoniensis]